MAVFLIITIEPEAKRHPRADRGEPELIRMHSVMVDGQVPTPEVAKACESLVANMREDLYEIHAKPEANRCSCYPDNPCPAHALKQATIACRKQHKHLSPPRPAFPKSEDQRLADEARDRRAALMGADFKVGRRPRKKARL